MDRNVWYTIVVSKRYLSLSARRAWIEITMRRDFKALGLVALRKESVDRNRQNYDCFKWIKASLSARRAWIEMIYLPFYHRTVNVALRKESVDRNACIGFH